METKNSTDFLLLNTHPYQQKQCLFSIQTTLQSSKFCQQQFFFNTFLAMLKFNSFSKTTTLFLFARKTTFYLKLLDRNYTAMDKNSNLSSQKYNFKIMKIETKLQQKLFNRGTLTWENENHAEHEQKRIKAILRIFDLVNNPIQFDFFFFFLLFCIIPILVQNFCL